MTLLEFAEWLSGYEHADWREVYDDGGREAIVHHRVGNLSVWVGDHRAVQNGSEDTFRRPIEVRQVEEIDRLKAEIASLRSHYEGRIAGLNDAHQAHLVAIDHGDCISTKTHKKIAADLRALAVNHGDPK